MKRERTWLAGLFSSDHRKSVRRSAPGLVAYYWEGTAPIAHEIQNISSTGFYLLTRESWHPGTIVTMTLQKPGVAGAAPELYIAVQSKVVRRDENGIGFVFLHLERQGSHPQQEPNSKNRQASRKALEEFLEQLKIGLGHVPIGAPAGKASPRGARAWQCLEEAP